MTKRLLNLHTITKIALILTTLLLLPSICWATEYNTTGTPTVDTESGASNKYNWAVTGTSEKWQIISTARLTRSESGFSCEYDEYLSFTLNTTLTNPTGDTCTVRRITITMPEADYAKCSISIDGFTKESNGVYVPNNNDKTYSWGIGASLTINFTKGSGNNTISVNSIKVEADIDDTNEQFSWPATISGTSVSFNNEKNSLAINARDIQKYSFPLNLSGSTAVSQSRTVTYSSSKEDIATVDENGNVTIKKIGSTTITATLQNNDDYYYSSTKSYSYTLDVEFPAPQLFKTSGTYKVSDEINFYYYDSNNPPTIKYKWNDSEDIYVYDSDSAPKIKDGTITAWAEVTNQDQNITIKSEEATATYLASYITIGTNDNITEVTSQNADNISGSGITGNVSYNIAKSTLSLNGATITSPIHQNFGQSLTIEISGTNVTREIVGYGVDNNDLHIIKAGESAASLEATTDRLTGGDGMGPIYHFSSCTWDEGLYLNAFTSKENNSNIEYEPISGVSYTGSKFQHVAGTGIARVTFCETPSTAAPSIWIGSVEVNEDGTFNDYNADQISFNSSTKTLTLSGANLYYDIVSSYPELNILLKENKSIPTKMSTSTKIISTNPDAILSFSSENGGYLSTSLGNGVIPWKGFANDTKPTFNNGLVYLANGDCQFIMVLPAPTISMDESSVSVTGLGDGYGNYFNYFYTINYEDGEGNVSKTNEPLEPESVEVLNIPVTVKPFTISVSAAFTDQLGNKAESEETIGKYFGFETEELSVPYQESVNAPSIVPTLPSGVTTTYSYQGGPDIVPNPINSGTGIITINELTEKEPYAASFTAPSDDNYTILNEPYGINSESGTVESYSIEPFTLTVTQKPLTDVTIEDIPDQPFTGIPITPEVVIKNGELKVTDDDCEITYSNNTNVGTATITITPVEISRYSGSATKTFNITAQSIANADITLDNGSEFTYNEAKNVPTIKSAFVTIGTSTPEVTAPSLPLTAETDYTISYNKNGENIDANNIINAGTYKMVLTGKGNFTGTKEIPFTITPRPIETPIITLSATEFVFNSQTQKPTVTVQFTETSEVTKTIPATDYEVTYSGDCINVGSYAVSILLKGNYTGTATATFTITKATITPTVTLEGWTYGATANEPSVTGNSGSGVVSYAYKLQHAAEEAYSATKPTNAGAYTVKASIAATANYEATTDSAHFTIAKAAGGLTYSTATASAELNGDGWTAPELKNPNSLAVTYTSSNTAVATISETGVVTLVGTGETTIKAASEGDANHEACEVQYTLTVSRGRALGYGVWVGETEVDEDNYIDILNDGEKDDDGEYTKAPSFIFNPKDTTLLIINSDAGMTIESRLPELKIHLSNDNKLKKIFFNNQGNSENTGKLLFTCDSNFPGSVTIGNTVGESAISGFASVSYEFNLQVLKPAKAKYANGQMTDSLGVVADTITVGVPLEPIKSDDKEELNSDDFTVTNSDGSTATLDLTSANVNNIYYTLPESTEGQGYDPETNTISVVDPMTDDAVEQIAAATTNKNATVGTSEYAESFVGLTFIVQGGEGVIRIDQETEEGYEFHLKIGDKPSIALKSGKEEIEYSLPDATYCWLYLVRKVALARGYTRVSKRDRAPGNVRLVKVQSKVVASTKSAAAASGGTVTPTANLAITGIVDIDKETPESKYTVETVNDKWYTIDGRQINKPSQKGIYIRNRKKVVVK